MGGGLRLVPVSGLRLRTIGFEVAAGGLRGCCLFEPNRPFCAGALRVQEQGQGRTGLLGGLAAQDKGTASFTRRVKPWGPVRFLFRSQAPGLGAL